MPAPTPDQLQRFVFSEIPRDDWHKTLVDAKANTILRLSWRGVMTPSQDGVIFRVARRTTFKGRMPGVALTIEPFSPKAGKFVKPPKGYGSEMSRYRLYIRDSGRVGMAIGDLALDLKTVEMGSAPKRGKAPKKAPKKAAKKAPKKAPTAAPIANPDVQFSVRKYPSADRLYEYQGIFYKIPARIPQPVPIGDRDDRVGYLKLIAKRLQEIHDETQRRAGPAPGRASKELRAQAVISEMKKEMGDPASRFRKELGEYEQKLARGRRQRWLVSFGGGKRSTRGQKLLLGSVDLSNPVIKDGRVDIAATKGPRSKFIPDPYGTMALRVIPGPAKGVVMSGLDLFWAGRLADEIEEQAEGLPEEGFRFSESTGESEGNSDLAIIRATVDGSPEHFVVSSGTLTGLQFKKNGEIDVKKTRQTDFTPSIRDDAKISVVMTGNTLSKATAKALVKWIRWAVEKGEKRAADWKRDEREQMQIAMAETSLERADARRRDARAAAAKPSDRNVLPDFHRRIENASFGPQLTDVDFVNVGRGNLKFKRGTMFVITRQGGKTFASSLPTYLRYEGLSHRKTGAGDRIAMTFSVLTPDNFTDMESVMRWTRRPGDGGVELLLADNSRVVSPALLLVGSKRYSADEFEMREVTLPSASKSRAKPKAKPKAVEKAKSADQVGLFAGIEGVVS